MSSDQKLAAVMAGKAFLAGIDLSSFRASRALLPKASLRSRLAEAATSGADVGAGAPTAPAPSTSDATGAQSQSSSSGTAITIDNMVAQGAGTDASFVAANTILSFTSGVTTERRAAAARSSELASLIARDAFPDTSADNWAANTANKYFEALVHLGWVQQTQNVGFQSFKGDAATVETAIFSIIAGLLGESGVLLVKGILQGLTALADNAPALTLFKQQSAFARAAAFGIGLASTDANGQFLLKVLEFDVTAEDDQTDVLFFSWDTTKATVKYQSLSFSFDDEVYGDLASTILPLLVGVDVSYLKSVKRPSGT